MALAAPSGGGAEDDDEALPRSPALVVEPRTKPYDVGTSVARTSFDILFEASPFGWAVGDADDGYNGFLHIGLGAQHERRKLKLGVFAGYELSSFSKDAFRAQLFTLYKLGGPALPTFHAAGIIDTSGRPGFAVAAGWAALTIEYQRRSLDDVGAAHLINLKISTMILEMYDELTYKRRTE